MNESQVFTDALKLATPAERSAYLDKACAGDPALRAGVERLIRAHDRDPGFLEQPASSITGAGTAGQLTATVTLTGMERPGLMLGGRYKLLEEIGEGGMGTVWMAQQTEPVRRTVAVKLIKPGMDSKAVLARFEAERQVLALMDHPNIAKVFDAGAALDGRPFFAMELVKGVPITKFCDDHRLTPRQRLELFVPVCHAIQHAHQKGIIHRDLKPSNVLVALYDDRPVPKVIDFGVAKATGQQVTEQTLHTSFGAVVGTVEYMSPEQATFNQLDVDTRSDIYSLGVLLYELLTGTTPMERNRLQNTPLLEMLRIIREDETVRPSTRLSTVKELPAIAANRGLDPKRLSGLVRGELDWIVMKALEKNRARRYESASGLATDVQRYLADEPVLACPPSAGYRIRKFARRNRVSLAVTALVLFFLFLLGSGIGWVLRDRTARDAEVARLQAERHAKVAGQVESILSEVDQLERDQAWPEALVAARRAEAAVASGEADTDTVDRVRDRLRDLEFINRLEQIRMDHVPADFGQANREYARAFRDYGVDVDELTTEASIERLKSRPGLVIPIAAALDHWAVIRMTMNEWARVSNASSAGSTRMVVVARGIDPEPLRDWLRSTSGQPVTREGKEELRRLAESFDTRAHHPVTARGLARTLAKGGLPEEAVRVLRDAQFVYPADYWLNRDLGLALIDQRNYEEAIRFLTVAVSTRPNAAIAHYHLGVPLLLNGKRDEAIAAHRKACELAPWAGLFKVELAHALSVRGNIDEAIAVYEQAVRRHPKDARVHYAFGVFLRDVKRDYPAAMACLKRATELDPRDEQIHLVFARMLRRCGKADDAAAAYEQAIRHWHSHACFFEFGCFLRDVKRDYARAIDCFKKAIELEPSFPEYRASLGYTLGLDGKREEAVAAYEEALRRHPDEAYPLHAFACFLRDIPLDYEGAIAAFKKAVELGSSDAHVHYEFASLLAKCPNVRLRDPGLAVAMAKKAIELGSQGPETLNTLGVAYYRAGDWRAAITALEKSVELGKGGNCYNWFFLAMARWKIGERDKAREDYDRAVRSMEQNKPKDADLLPIRAEALELLELNEKR